MRREKEAYKQGYRHTAKGRIIGLLGSVLKPWAGKDGRLSFRIKYKRRNVNVSVHRFVAFCKFGDRMYSPGIEVRYKDPAPSNTHPGNLRLGTKRQNYYDRTESERRALSEAGARARRKLSNAETLRLRQDRERGYTYKKLMKKYKLAKSTVSYIVNHKTYSGVV